MPHPGRMTTQKAKDFKGTMRSLLAELGHYKFRLIAVIVFAVLSTAHEQTDQRSQHGNRDRPHQDDPQCGPPAIKQAGQHAASKIVRTERKLRTGG